MLSEDQCKARDARRKAKQKFVLKKEAHSPDSYGHSSEVDTVHLVPHIDTKPSLPTYPSMTSSCSDAGESPCSMLDDSIDPMKKLTQEQKEFIEILVALQDKYEFADQQSYEETLVRNIHSGFGVSFGEIQHSHE